MARASLHAPVGNPNNLSAMPRSRPRLTFRTRVFSQGSDFAHALKVLGFGLMYGLMTFVWLVFTSDRKLNEGLGLFIVLLVIVCLSSRLLRPAALAFAMSIACAIGVSVVRPSADQTLVASLVALTLLAVLFRLHYAGYCQAGWGQFAGEWRLRRGSTIKGFFDAVIQWINYNRHGCDAPGVRSTIAGPYTVRLALTVATVVLLSYSLPALANHYALANGPEPELESSLLFALSFIAPVPTVLLACFLVSAPILGRCHAMRIAADKGGLARSWPSLLEHIRTSSDETERDSLYLGHVDYDNSPVLVPMDTARKHIWAVGGTGSGKTTFLTSLIEQIGYRGDTSIFIGDLKADTYELLASIEWVRESLEQRSGRKPPLWLLTNRHGFASHLFSLFHQPQWPALSATQKTDVLMSAMSLSFSRSFGESWYSDACYHLLHFVIQKYPEISSFRELAERIAYEIKSAKNFELSRSVKQDGEHVRLVLERLASADAFNYGDGVSNDVTENALELARLFREPCFVYGAFSSLLAPTTSPELLRVVVSAMLTIGTMVSERRTKIVLVLDEWQRMVAGNLELLLQQARSMGVTVVLANQTVADLRQGSIDLTSTVEGNTSIQAWFKDMDQLGQQQLKTFAGMTVDTLQDTSTSVNDLGTTKTVSTKQFLVNRLETNEIAAASSRPDTYILRVTDNRGYAHYDGLPFAVRYQYHITKTERERRERLSWPVKTPGTIVVGQSESNKQSSPSLGPPRSAQRGEGRVLSRGTVGGKPRNKGRNR